MTFRHQTPRNAETWVVVADRARARLFAGEWPDLDDLHQVDCFIHAEGAAHPRDVEADTQGRKFESQGAKHKAEPRTDFKHRTAAEFAHELVEKLRHGKDENAYGRLVLIAPALFLGVLRQSLPDPVQRLVIADLDKDLTHADEKTIAAEVSELLTAIEAP